MLNAYNCEKLSCFPSAINLPSLETLYLNGCRELENFPEILQEMKNVTMLFLNYTGIKDLPCSFRNLSGLEHLDIRENKMCRMPSVVAMMPQLVEFNMDGGDNKEGKVSGKQEKEGLQLQVEGILTHSLSSSKVESLHLNNCELPDGFIPLAVAWFPNVTKLDLRGSNFTILPECIQQFRFLRKLNVDECEHLREIRGSPPCLRDFSAIYCKSLSHRGTIADGCDEALLLENEWNHANVSYKARRFYKKYEHHEVQIESIAKEIGLHVRKQKISNIMQDIRFIDPYKMREVIIMMMMVSMVLPNHRNQPLLLETRIGLWTLLFLTHTALASNTLT
ncbi:hypothetical protein PIB30_092810 [Stylosanthes scabra]|uniref:Disease resistance protein RPS4B/Roq1-like leucine-rich repeats domain-containing protein n=1 Tax=Stylosanthes scabra TaxID=79078 RepID=A0ABU6VWS7_9FABA|nr:hypothetical protein [Stylosanthes scabra]